MENPYQEYDREMKELREHLVIRNAMIKMQEDKLSLQRSEILTQLNQILYQKEEIQELEAEIEALQGDVSILQEKLEGYESEGDWEDGDDELTLYVDGQ